MSGNRIAYWRKQRGVSQGELADALGTGRSTIAKLEKGERGLSQDWMVRIGRALEIAPAELMDSAMLSETTEKIIEAPIVPWPLVQILFGDAPQDVLSKLGHSTLSKKLSTLVVSYPHKAVAAVEVSDDQIDRIIAPGSYALVDRSDRTLRDHKLYLLEVNGHIGLFIYRDTDGPPRFSRASHNVSWATVYPDQPDGARVAGRVVRVFRML